MATEEVAVFSSLPGSDWLFSVRNSIFLALNAIEETKGKSLLCFKDF